MVIVRVTSGAHNIVLEVENDEIGHFLISDECSSAREYLLEFLAAGYLESRPEWNETRMRQDLLIAIPSLNLEYILQKEPMQQHPDQPQAVVHHPKQPQEVVQHPDQPQAVLQHLNQPQAVVQPHNQPQQVEEQQLDQPRLNKHNKKKGSTRWTYQATQRLIFHWKKRKERFENNIEKNETIWEELTEAMVAEGFSDMNALQCENKFKYLKRIYMETKDINRKSTGQPEKTCSYYEEMDSIFKKSPQICPPSLASSRDGASCTLNQSYSPRECSRGRGSAPVTLNLSTTSTEHSDSAQAGTISSGTETQTSTRPPAKKTRLESSLSKWVEKFEDKSSEREAARQKRHEELMQVQRESNELYKAMMLKLLEKL